MTGPTLLEHHGLHAEAALHVLGHLVGVLLAVAVADEDGLARGVDGGLRHVGSTRALRDALRPRAVPTFVRWPSSSTCMTGLMDSMVPSTAVAGGNGSRPA